MGYRRDYSMSTNAAQARDDKKFPATEIAALLGRSATAAGVKSVLTSSEWHHTSSRYNETFFYDIDDARDRLDEIIAASKKIEAEKKAVPETRETGIFLFEEWGGSRRYPVKRIEMCEGEIVTKGNWITLPNGSRKRADKVRALRGVHDLSSYAARDRAWISMKTAD